MAQVSTKLFGTDTPMSGAAKSGTYPSAPRVQPERTLDEYDPTENVVAPISIRTSMMELLWICGDCGEHYPRAIGCPEQCDSCSAPKQHFYAPLED